MYILISLKADKEFWVTVPTFDANKGNNSHKRERLGKGK